LAGQGFGRVRRAVFLASVRADLIDILDYLTEASGSVDIAEAFVGQIRAKCHKLASLDMTMGRPRPDLRVDIRSFPFKGYIIFFRYVGDRFEVVNILNAHRDIDGYFGDERDL
jgi:plasmid stabilization system protein ParE